MINYLNYLENHILEVLKKSNKRNLVLGLSCGIDSVLVLKILSKIVNKDNLFVYFIDINSEDDKQYLELTKKEFKNINIQYVNLTNSYNILVNDLEVTNKTSLGNIKSKLRSMYLYNKAFVNNGLVVNTLNYSEYYIGYFTKFGDSNGDLFLINGLTKKYVYELAKLLKINDLLINRKPTSGLMSNTFDEDELGFNYKELDEYIENTSIINNIIEKMVNKNLHKRYLIKPFLLKSFKSYRE